MRYAFIKKYQDTFNIFILCDYLKVSRSCYYRWLKIPLSQREIRNKELKKLIFRTFSDAKGIYGSPRVHAVLKRAGILCNQKRVARLMREMGLRSIIKKKFKATTNSRHNKPVAKNLLDPKFHPPSPNLVWVSDVTYVFTKEGWL